MVEFEIHHATGALRAEGQTVTTGTSRCIVLR
jgi:hypothetical protein